jgi:hypothetical protein
MPGYPCGCGRNNCIACTGDTPDTMGVLINGTVSNGSCGDCGTFSNATITTERGRGSIGGPEEYPCYWALEDLVCGYRIEVRHENPFLFCTLSGSADTITFSKNVGETFDCTAQHELTDIVDSSGFECDFSSVTSVTINPP